MSAVKAPAEAREVNKPTAPVVQLLLRFREREGNRKWR